MARSEIALTLRTRPLSMACSAARRPPTAPGYARLRKKQIKQPANSRSAARPHAGIGATVTASSREAAASLPLLAAVDKGFASGATGSAGRPLNKFSFSKVFTARMADMAAHQVARKAVPMMADGLADLAAARMATAVIGMSCTELVLMARNVHMALVAVPGVRLRDSRSRMARSPR